MSQLIRVCSEETMSKEGGEGRGDGGGEWRGRGGGSSELEQPQDVYFLETTGFMSWDYSVRMMRKRREQHFKTTVLQRETVEEEDRRRRRGKDILATALETDKHTES